VRKGLIVVAFAASLTSTWSAVRLYGVQLSDAVLALWAVVLVVTAGPAVVLRAPRWLALPVLGAGVALVLQVVTASPGVELAVDLELLARLLTATVVVPAVIIASVRLQGAAALRAIVLGFAFSAITSVLAELYVTGGGTLPPFVIHELTAAGRGFGLALHPNSLGMTCVLALPFLLGGVRRYAPIPAGFALPGSALMLVGLLLADSRSALIVGGVVLLLAVGYLCTTQRAWPVGLPLLLLFVAAAFVYVPDVVAATRLSGSGSAEGSDQLRLLLRQEAFELIGASPVFGHQLSSIGAGVMTLLGLLVAGGVIFAVAYYAYFVAALRTLLQLARRGSAMATLCLVAALSFLTVGLAQPSTVERYTFWPVGLGLAVGVLAAWQRRGADVGARREDRLPSDLMERHRPERAGDERTPDAVVTGSTPDFVSTGPTRDLRPVLRPGMSSRG
jgi:hypothetical protein